MNARKKYHISVLRNNIIIRRTNNHHDTNFNEVVTILSMQCSLEEPLLLTTTIHVLDVEPIF